MDTHIMPGICILLGSGETTSMGRRVLSRLLPQLAEPREIAILDTPAGFQPNRYQVAENIARFLQEKLAEFHPLPRIIETRRAQAGTQQEAAALAALARARCIIAGPGSPTYMIRELMDTSYVKTLRGAHASGVALYIASAAAIALSTYSLPVYEIFKAGDDPHWQDGLDFFGPYDMSLAIVPHWNNREGGDSFDSRFCYMGHERFELLRQQLPAEVIILGIDEHTACILDFARGEATVAGKGAAYIIREGQLTEWPTGTSFPLGLLRSSSARPAGGYRQPVSIPLEYEPSSDPLLIEEAGREEKVPAQLIDAILAVRAELRSAKQWTLADRLRDALDAQGIVIEDTPSGAQWHIVDKPEAPPESR